MENFFAQCPRGLSGVLANELIACGAVEPIATEAGVAFKGDLLVAYRANLHSRVASRVLWQVAAFPYVNEHEIYDTALLLPWPSWFDVSCTIKVEISANKSPVKSLDFTTLRIKDAVCDKFREQIGSRPSVATREPDVRIHAHLEEKDAALYLDLSGEALFKRGLREQTGAAPLKKNLAAGIIALSGWKPDEAFLDPMCGSGTFLIEAAQIALNIAPGNDGKNRHFAFQKLKNFDEVAWKKMVADARAAEKPKTLLPIYGSDLYGYALDDARANLVANDLADCVRIKQANILEISAPAESGVLVTNPPYGERLGETADLAELYPKLGDVLKQKFAGWRAYFFTGDTGLPKGVRLSASKKTPLFNGKLECRLYEYKIIAGSNRKETKP
jgi:putative N6-adenine-specific DNA methylase